MKNLIAMFPKRLFLIPVLMLFVHVSSSHAQIWKKVQNTIEEKASNKIDDVLSGKKQTESTPQNRAGAEKPATSNAEEFYAFQPGDSVIFATDFAHDTKGRMAKRWKSSGSGSVASIEGVPGNWLALAEQSTYKIDSLFDTPENFTIEFDLVTRSNESADIGSMSFGFARDNSVANHLLDAYNGNAITNTQLHFHNQEITNASSDTKNYITIDFPFANYSNAVLHVAIAVEGDILSIYINKSKVLDTRMFNKDVPKFFYITAPFSYEQQSQVYFGNFVMATD